jgi:imidazolonepropionase-like amidohydrolase
MVAFGMTPMEAIIASTATAAQLIGIQDAVGTLTKEMEADLVILKGNPLRRIEVLRDRSKIVGVMKAGKFVAGVLAK